MRERMAFVVAHGSGLYTMAELCERHGVSRKTGYKWLARYGESGPAALSDRSHRPHECPHETPAEVVRLILQLQRRHTWGARKVRTLLAARIPGDQVPTKTTVHRILERHGRVKPRRRRRRRFHQPIPD